MPDGGIILSAPFGSTVDYRLTNFSFNISVINIDLISADQYDNRFRAS